MTSPAEEPLQNHVLSLWPRILNGMDSHNEEAQLSFLLSGTYDVVPSSYIKLRSYLNIHISNLADQLNLNLPKNFRNRNKTCPYCYTDWSSDTSSFKLLPSKKKKIRKLKKEIGDKDLLKESRNTLVLKCKVCTNKSLFSLVKKLPVKEAVKEQTVISGKRKKKKRDRSCGLFVNLLKEDSSAGISKKEKRSKNTSEFKNPASTSKQPPSNLSHSPKNTTTLNSVSNKNKTLLPNPFASQSQGKFSKNKNRKLQSLKKAVKREKGMNFVKKTLKDFLTLI